jgi:hypothetical protein
MAVTRTSSPKTWPHSLKVSKSDLSRRGCLVRRRFEGARSLSSAARGVQCGYGEHAVGPALS